MLYFVGECASVEAEHLVPVAAARPLVVGAEGWIGTMCPASEGLAWGSIIKKFSLAIIRNKNVTNSNAPRVTSVFLAVSR